MPDPEWASTIDVDLLERPHTGTEILGRGASARKSKTYLEDLELASLLGFIRGHCRRLMEAFRHAHAKHHYVERLVQLDDGKTRIDLVPEVLTDEEVRRRYPVVAEWERLHQEQVDHFASIKGFSVKAASGLDEDGEPKYRQDSSAGTDRQRRTGAGNIGAEPKWR